jgi:hypothetical protein
MAHGDAREGELRGNRRMEWVGSALPLYLGTRSIQHYYLLPADPHTSTASTRLNWLHHRFKWTRPFPWKTKSGFCACAITFKTEYTILRGLRHEAILYAYFSSLLFLHLTVIPNILIRSLFSNTLRPDFDLNKGDQWCGRHSLRRETNFHTDTKQHNPNIYKL